MTDRIKWGEPVTGLDGVIAVAQALKDGKKIQIKGNCLWLDVIPDLHALFLSCIYRIGEEVRPREFWVNVYASGSYASAYERKADADSGDGHGRLECIHVREVIE